MNLNELKGIIISFSEVALDKFVHQKVTLWLIFLFRSNAKCSFELLNGRFSFLYKVGVHSWLELLVEATLKLEDFEYFLWNICHVQDD